MNIYDFLRDHHVQFIEEGTQHCAPGWIQMPCPFCSGPFGYHLGYNLDKSYWNCWRCGWKPNEEVVQKIGRLKTAHEAYQIIRIYSIIPDAVTNKSKQPFEQTKAFIDMPPNFLPLQAEHKQYLESRNFDPDQLEEQYKLKGTNHIGPFSFRIIAPIYFNNYLVSYQGRDITDQAKAKYKPCLKEEAAISHKYTLYGIDDVPGNIVVVVEGITDVWRLGAGAVAVFGIQFTQYQLNLLKRFQTIYFLFDAEPTAQKQAQKAATALSNLNKHVELLELESGLDPGNLSQNDATDLMNELLK